MAVDLDAIRARHREAYGDPATPMGAMRDVAALLAERDRLAAVVDRVAAIADAPHLATPEALSTALDNIRSAINTLRFSHNATNPR